MRLSTAALALPFLAATTSAFSTQRSFAVTKGSSVASNKNVVLRDTAADLGLPCEDECALQSFPKMPPSVHPGVVTGEAMLDLLNHAKENGE